MKSFVVRAGAVAALALVALVPAGTAASAAPVYPNRPLCIAAGELGIEQGRWDYYICAPVRIDDVYYYRLVPDPR